MSSWIRTATLPAGAFAALWLSTALAQQHSGIEGSPRPIHQLAIVALGLPLIDVMDLEAVAAEASPAGIPGNRRSAADAGRHKVPDQPDRDVLIL